MNSINVDKKVTFTAATDVSQADDSLMQNMVDFIQSSISQNLTPTLSDLSDYLEKHGTTLILQKEPLFKTTKDNNEENASNDTNSKSAEKKIVAALKDKKIQHC